MHDVNAIARTDPERLSFTSENLQLVLQEYNLQVAVQKATRAKTAFGLQQIAELHAVGALTKKQTFRLLVSLDVTAEFQPPYDTIWAEAMRQQVLEFIDHIHKAVRLGAGGIAEEIARTLYILPEPPPKPGLLERIMNAIMGGPR